jgi:hypothetical protein
MFGGLSPVIRISIIAAMMPLGLVGYEREANEGERHLWLEAHILNKLKYLRGPGESDSDVIMRIARAAA